MNTIISELKAQYLTINEAAGVLRRSPWDIMGAIEKGDLRAFQPGHEGAWLIRPADLGAYVGRFENTSETLAASARREAEEAREAREALRA